MRYIAIEEKQIKQLKREAQQYQDDITCAVGTDFLQKIAEAENKTIFEIIKTIENAPTEDVVPRSEVEEADKEIARLKEILTNYALQYGTVKTQQKVINQAKQEIAREIFEEIEGNTNQAIKRLKDAKEGVTDKDLRNYVNGKIGEVENTQTFIAELKKKYIGE